MTIEMSSTATGSKREAPVGSLPRVGSLTIDGPIDRTLENVKRDANQRVVNLVSRPISGLGGVVSRNGASAPEGAIVKVANMTKLLINAPTRRISRDENAIAAFESGTTMDREASRAPSDTDHTHLRSYAGQAGPAVNGAVTSPGGKA